MRKGNVRTKVLQLSFFELILLQAHTVVQTKKLFAPEILFYRLARSLADYVTQSFHDWEERTITIQS
jgi:hypothetical protein